MTGAARDGRYAVIGDPVAHSRSPRIFQFLQGLGHFPGSYDAVRVQPHELGAFLERLRKGELQGASVTLPHKEAALAACDEVSPVAREIGAVNCVVGGARLTGHNTDAVGFVRALAQHGLALKGAHVLVLGAGGAARAAAFAARSEGCASLLIANRSLERAQALVKGLRGVSARAVALEAAALRELAPSVTLVVNATRVGLSSPEDTPLPEGSGFGAGAGRMDMVYEPLRTRFLEDGRRAGAQTVDGLWMLVHQALEQLRLWTGYEGNSQLAEVLSAHLRKEPA